MASLTRTVLSEIKFFITIILIYISKLIIKLIPKQRNLIIFTSWFGTRYADNTMYVYERFLEEPKYESFWYTKSKLIYEELRRSGKPVILHNSLRYFWKIIRANVLFSTIQTSDYSPYLLSGCKLLDLGHGHPIKDIGSIGSNKKSKYLFSLSKKFIKFYMVVTSDFAKNRASLDFNIPEKNIFISNFARNDVFNDLSLRVLKNDLITSIKKDRKAIVYMPTHRSDGIVKMNIHEILDLERIQKICYDNNFVFIIKKHFYHRLEKEDLSKYLNIYDISSEENIDSQVLLSQTDILITDYSACFIDFLLLNRPIILYQYDIEEFQKNERSFFIPFTQLNIGEKPKNKLELNKTINEYISGYVDKYIEERVKLSMFYFNSLEPNKGRDNALRILDKII